LRVKSEIGLIAIRIDAICGVRIVGFFAEVLSRIWNLEKEVRWRRMGLEFSAESSAVFLGRLASLISFGELLV
jgi:hypothetical protein